MELQKLVDENVDVYRKLILWSCDNGNKVSDAYSNFLTTLAGFFIVFYPNIVNYNPGSNTVLLKIILGTSISLIFLSLIFGAITMLLKRRFYLKWLASYSEIFTKWNSCSNDIDKKRAIECEECVYSKNRKESPMWSLVTQTLLLFLGVLLAVIVFLLKMFA
jgi:hypothetical protein